ncbi:MAG: acyl-ACP--UDP-N-acetylglucosamine O-acyltransferase [Woeseiaceae bacterium]|nr:acyl-ACP--UDP-N-acetylglucosamine O-acyltransferase [Woeseiaceae bacterium]
MSDSLIHPTAIVSDGAILHPSVRVGPGAVIEGHVEIGANSTVGPHAVIRSFCRIGSNNRIDAHAVIGGDPQHTDYDGSETWVVIGDNNVVREFVTVHRPFLAGAETRIGSNCHLMAGVHVGHDTIMGDNVTLTSNVLLAGHVEVGDNVVMGGAAGAHQFTRIGPFCMVAGFVPLRKDALPFTLIGGDPVRHYRLNTIGLRRNGVKGDRYRALEAAFKALRDGDRELSGIEDTDEVAYLRTWLAVKSKYGSYGFARGKRGSKRGR